MPSVASRKTRHAIPLDDHDDQKCGTGGGKKRDNQEHPIWRHTPHDGSRTTAAGAQTWSSVRRAPRGPEGPGG